MPTTTGSRYLAEALHAYGVTHTFSVPTIAARAMRELEDFAITNVTTHGEKAAAYMADGYARVSGRPGVCLAQAIGAANLAAGLRDAYLCGSPVLAITGGRAPETEYRHVYQEIVDFPLYEQLTKMNVELDVVERLPDLLRQCFRALTSGPTAPVHMELRGPLGEILLDSLEITETSGPLAEERFARAPAFRPVADPADLDAAIAAIGAAERPVVVAGGGVVRSGAQEALVAFAEAFQIPVATSLHAKGAIGEDHPLALGVVGASGARPTANSAVLEADLVVYIASNTGSQVTGGWHVPRPGLAVVQLDIDPLELGRNYPNAASLLGDARVTLEALCSLAPPPRDRSAWTGRCRAIVAEWREEHAEVFASSQKPMRPERLARAITESLPDNGVLLADTGHSGQWTGNYVELRAGQLFLRSSGTLGWSLPAAIGAKAAAPERQVVCFTGDGGAYYHVTELETAVRFGIEAVIVVNNNRSFAQNVGPFSRAYSEGMTPEGRRMWVFGERSFAEIATALGCPAIRVEDPDDVRDALLEAMKTPGPTLVDVVTDMDAMPDPLVGAIGIYGR